MVDVLPTATATTTFINEVMVGIDAMNAANKHAYSWGRAVGEDPSALLGLRFSERPLTPLQVSGIW
jgi:hypothetical protein